MVCGDKCVGDAGAGRARCDGGTGAVRRIPCSHSGQTANVSALIVAVVTRWTLIARFEHLYTTCIGVIPCYYFILTTHLVWDVEEARYYATFKL